MPPVREALVLAHGVTVALQILVLSVEVRILMGQQVKAQEQGTRKVIFKACVLDLVPCTLNTAL